jgi:hypothetical protein
MSRLAAVLSDVLGRPVVDKSGFNGTFDARLEFAPEETPVDPVSGDRVPTFHGLGPPFSAVKYAGDLMALNWGRGMKAMVLSANEESLINVVRMLPPGEAGKVLIWAQQLADLAGGRRVDWSDSWSDDDLRDATVASLERFEKQEREGH